MNQQQLQQRLQRVVDLVDHIDATLEEAIETVALMDGLDADEIALLTSAYNAM